MKIREAGVIWRDGMYFRSADLFAKSNLLYILWGSTYLVDSPYEVKRSYMDAYMLQYVVSGELHCDIRGERFTVKENELVLLDCKEANHYWAKIPTKIKWFHFNGKPAQALVEYIYANNKNGRFGSFHAKNAEPFIDEIMNLLKNKTANDFQISRGIYSILCELAAPAPLKVSPAEDAVNKAIQYMKDNFDKAVSVKDAAAYAGLSPFYFTRLFKKSARISPHAYLTNLRMDNAKNLLVYTAYSIEEIAEKSGFQSASHFIRAFKQSTGLTPNNFRRCSVCGIK